MEENRNLCFSREAIGAGVAIRMQECCIISHVSAGLRHQAHAIIGEEENHA